VTGPCGIFRSVLRRVAAGALLALAATRPAGAGEPLSAWLDSMGSAAQALDAGDGARALAAATRARAALPAGDPGARARLAAGLAAERVGRGAHAALEIRAAIPFLPDPARPFALEHLASSLAVSGHPGAAAAALAEAAALSAAPERSRLALAEARALSAAGLPGAAARAAGPLADSGDPAAALVRANALRALGDPRAAESYRALWVDRAGEPEGEDAGAALAAIGAPAPSTADRLARAERLLAGARPGLAVRELDEADRGGAPTARALLLRAVALLQLGRPAEAEVIARALADPPSGPEARAAQWVLARAAARQGRLEEAAERYRRVAAERPVVPGLAPAQQAELPEEASYLAAWLWYDAGQFAKAVPRLARFAREHPSSKRALDARWFQAWATFRAGPPAQARRAFAALAADGPLPLRPAALYWEGRVASSPARAAALYAAAAREGADGWYGLLASARLAEMGLSPPRPPPLPPGSPAPAPSDARIATSLALAGELLGLGARDDALGVLRRLSASPSARAAAAPLAELAAAAGDAEIPFRMARDHLGVTRRTERWAYPEAFRASVLPATSSLGVDPMLALAVMRRESAFRTGVRSGAAAEGLLQLRPETAERVAALFGLPGPPAGALADPVSSVPLGVAYLGLLGGRFPLAPALLAAYNAGPGRAAAWSERLRGTPVDEWVEDVPYRETRQYVRAVAADWAHYRRLAGEPPPPIDPSAPVPAAPSGVAF